MADQIFRATPARLFRRIGLTIGNLNYCAHNYLRQYRGLFGCTPLKAALLWDLTNEIRPAWLEPENILWACLLAKQYLTEEVLAKLCGTTEKTFREKAWDTLEIIGNVGLIDWERRKVSALPHNRILVSVDGTDYRIKQQRGFNKKWYSHKFHGPGVRYEIAISIQTGWIVWINGPFPCGEWPDVRIFRECLMYKLMRGEFYIADKGYRDGYNYCYSPTGNQTYADRQISLIRARHENINRRMKEFGALQNRWRHSIGKHEIMTRAIATIVQLGLETDQQVRHIHYDEREFGQDFLLNRGV